MAFKIFAGLAAVAILIQPSFQQKDPLKDFCRRFGHQTTVVDNKLFIDGGLINYNPLDQNPLNYTNTGLLYADITVSNQGMPQEYANLSKPAEVPSVAGGTLWNDDVNKMIYLYGGEFQSSPQSFSMWAYDVLGNNWTVVDPDVSQQGILRASYGGSASVQDTGLSYYYGGWVSNTTTPIWGANPVLLSNFLQFDMVAKVWTNSSGPDTVGRGEGVMVYIPASDGGMLVYFGGIQAGAGGNGNWTGQPMDTIFLYDIANAKWYEQQATGTIPEMRRRFCAGVVWSDDQSSYQIYLYGGASMPPFTVGFDDVYILSIPTFTWIKWYPTTPGTAYPHHSLTCNVINNSQMIVQGGSFPNSSICDVPNVYGMHNLYLGKDAKGDQWALFNDSYVGYKVPSEVLAVVGGRAEGGATKKTPLEGFSNNDLAVYFTRMASIASTRTATRDVSTAAPTKTNKPTPSKKSNGAVIGGAVGGGIAALLILGALVFFCLRRKKTNQNTHQPLQQQDTASPTQYPTHQVVYPNTPPAQLATHEHGPIAELQGAEVVGAGLVQQPYEKAPAPKYSYFPSPSQSPPPRHSPAPVGYFPPPSELAVSPAPAYAHPQGFYGQPQPQQQQHYPAPGSPQQQQYYQPPTHSPQYSPPSQQGYPTPTSAHSPEQGYDHSPVNQIPRRSLPQ